MLDFQPHPRTNLGRVAGWNDDWVPFVFAARFDEAISARSRLIPRISWPWQILLLLIALLWAPHAPAAAPAPPWTLEGNLWCFVMPDSCAVYEFERDGAKTRQFQTASDIVLAPGITVYLGKYDITLSRFGGRQKVQLEAPGRVQITPGGELIPYVSRGSFRSSGVPPSGILLLPYRIVNEGTRYEFQMIKDGSFYLETRRGTVKVSGLNGHRSGNALAETLHRREAVLANFRDLSPTTLGTTRLRPREARSMLSAERLSQSRGSNPKGLTDDPNPCIALKNCLESEIVPPLETFTNKASELFDRATQSCAGEEIAEFSVRFHDRSPDSDEAKRALLIGWTSLLSVVPTASVTDRQQDISNRLQKVQNSVWAQALEGLQEMR